MWGWSLLLCIQDGVALLNLNTFEVYTLQMKKEVAIRTCINM